MTVKWEPGDDTELDDDMEPGDEGKGEGLDGKVVCLWSDANAPGTIPAFDEVRRFAPVWVAVTKSQDGLVEGGKAFMV